MKVWKLDIVGCSVVIAIGIIGIPFNYQHYVDVIRGNGCIFTIAAQKQ